MIFNVVVDAVIRHWAKVVGVSQEGAGQGLGMSIQTLSVLSYVNDRFVTSPDSAGLKGVFDALTQLFDPVGLWTNKRKKVSTDYRPYHTPHTWSTESYYLRVTERGLSYRERLRQMLH